MAETMTSETSLQCALDSANNSFIRLPSEQTLFINESLPMSIITTTENENRTGDHDDYMPSAPEIEEELASSLLSNGHLDQSDITDLKNVQKFNETSDHVLICGTTNEKKEFSKDISSFLEDMYDLLECPVCLLHMIPPIILCESGHNVCFKCRPFMTKCPLCRGSFLKTRNVALEIVSRKLGLSREDCHKECSGLQVEQEPYSLAQFNQVTYTCPFTLYTHCYWQGNYSDIRRHMEDVHGSKVLTEEITSIWEMNLVVKDFKVIFACNEIFFYKERLDTSNSKFYIQVFYVGQRENHTQFSYYLVISSVSGEQKIEISKTTLPIEDLEHNYTYSSSHSTILDYSTVSGISKHGDLKCTLTIQGNLRQ